ncbi:MAG: protein kinase domain-containing protein, partial [Chloroflexia bacterium]
MEQLRGHRLGKYHILEEIGRGGMKAVFKGYDPDLDRFVAVAVLAPHLTWEPDFVQRFLREARAAARLRHPHIVTIFDVGQESGWFFFVMEYLEGRSLKEVLYQQGALPPAEALAILSQVADALDYAHQRGLVHRDVKPGNVVVDPRGRATLTDFGIAKAAYESKLTATGLALGTPEYMAPEQIAGGEVGPWTDNYALGVVAYEMLSGRLPFEGDTAPAVLYRVVHQPMPSIRSFRPDLPEEVEAVLERALAKEPGKRFPTASALVSALAQALRAEQPRVGFPVVARPAPPPPFYPTEKPTEVLPLEPSPAVPAGPAGEDVPAVMARASALARSQAAPEEDWNQTIAALERLLEKSPRYPGAQELVERLKQQRALAGLYSEARQACVRGQRGQALSILRNLLKLEPEYGDASALLERLAEEAYQELQAAFRGGEWAAAVRLAGEIPGYRDSDALRVQAEQALAQEQRQEGVYDRLQRAMKAQNWTEAAQLAGQIPGYRDADALKAQAEQALAQERRQEEAYARLLAAVRGGRWEEALGWAEKIPGYRDADELRRQAQAEVEEEERRADAYRRLEEAVASSRWQEAVALAERIPGYRDTDRLRKQAEEALEEIYGRLHKAVVAGRWQDAIAAAETIAGYRDSDSLRELAERSLEKAYQQLLGAIASS